MLGQNQTTHKLRIQLAFNSELRRSNISRITYDYLHTLNYIRWMEQRRIHYTVFQTYFIDKWTQTETIVSFKNIRKIKYFKGNVHTYFFEIQTSPKSLCCFPNVALPFYLTNLMSPFIWYSVRYPAIEQTQWRTAALCKFQYTSIWKICFQYDFNM